MGMGRGKGDDFLGFPVYLSRFYPRLVEKKCKSTRGHLLSDSSVSIHGSALHADMDMAYLKIILVPHSTVKNPCSLRVKPCLLSYGVTPAC